MRRLPPFRPARLGRQGRRSVLDRARCVACGRPRVSGRHRVDLSGWDPCHAKNLFAGHTVYSIVLEVPDQRVARRAGDNRRIGVWAVATLATDAGGWRSINRVGLPMIHPLFTQYNEDLGNRLNAGVPYRRSRHLRMRPSSNQSPASSRLTDSGRSQAYAEKVAHRFLPQHPALRGRHPGGVRFRRMERPLADRQCARCHVLPGCEHSIASASARSRSPPNHQNGSLTFPWPWKRRGPPQRKNRFSAKNGAGAAHGRPVKAWRDKSDLAPTLLYPLTKSKLIGVPKSPRSIPFNVQFNEAGMAKWLLIFPLLCAASGWSRECPLRISGIETPRSWHRRRTRKFRHCKTRSSKRRATMRDMTG